MFTDTSGKARLFIEASCRPSYVRRGGRKLCSFCYLPLQKGEEIITITTPLTTKQKKKILIRRKYHHKCLVKKFTVWFADNPMQPERRNRPGKVYPERRRGRRRLLSLRWYHRKVGNTERVMELTKEMEAMEAE